MKLKNIKSDQQNRQSSNIHVHDEQTKRSTAGNTDTVGCATKTLINNFLINICCHEKMQ